MKRLQTPTLPLMAAAVLAFLGAALLYAATIPVFEGFDAQAHYAAVHAYRSERTLPVLTPETVQVSYELIPHPPLYYVLSALAGTGWPLQPAMDSARASVNAYFDKSLSTRQSVTLPGVPWPDLAPAWAARAVAILGGLIAVLCAWWMGRRLFPALPTLALAAAAIAGLNPQFLFTSITISNDAWAAATCALALALGIEVVVQERRPWTWLGIGAAVGLAALAKYSGLLVGLPLALLWLIYWRRQGTRAALAALGFAALACLLVAGWWFARNWLLYGEIIPFDRMAAVLPSMRRPEPYTWAHTLELAPWLFASFWGVFVAVIAPAWVLTLAQWFTLAGLAGLGVALLRLAWVRRWDVRMTVLYGVLLPWLIAVAFSVLYWTRTVEYGEQGRLGHIGASALGVVLAAGWQGWVPRRWAPALHVVLAGGMLTVALALLPFLHAHFGLPPAVAAPLTPDRTVDARFDGGMRVLGMDLPQGGAIEANQPLTVTLYLSTDAPIQADYTLFLHVAGPDDRLLYQFDGVPANGLHPTRQWVPGQVFADTHVITVTGPFTPGQDALATLSVGFYPIADPSKRQTAYGADGIAGGDRLALAQLRTTAASPVPLTETPFATWANGIRLVRATVEPWPDTLARVALTWTTTATLQQDYTVFVQALDAQGNVVAQSDSPPQGGRSPTSTWRAGDVFQDTVLLEGDAERWQRIILGLYDSSGTRLPLVSPAGADNAVDLAQR